MHSRNKPRNCRDGIECQTGAATILQNNVKLNMAMYSTSDTSNTIFVMKIHWSRHQEGSRLKRTSSDFGSVASFVENVGYCCLRVVGTGSTLACPILNDQRTNASTTQDIVAKETFRQLTRIAQETEARVRVEEAHHAWIAREPDAQNVVAEPAQTVMISETVVLNVVTIPHCRSEPLGKGRAPCNQSQSKRQGALQHKCLQYQELSGTLLILSGASLSNPHLRGSQHQDSTYSAKIGGPSPWSEPHQQLCPPAERAGKCQTC